jgi:ribosomal protein S18 acetylase RimI-like enzyme
MDIRQLSPEDAGAYAALRLEMLHDSPWAFAASPADDRGLDIASLRARLAEPGQTIVGAFDTARLVAAAGVHRSHHLKMAHRAHIWGVYTAPSARGNGIASRVLATLLDIASTWPGVTSAGLSVSIRSPEAMSLYRKLGFRAWGTEPAALLLDGVPYNEVHMVAHLPSHP